MKFLLKVIAAFLIGFLAPILILVLLRGILD